MKTDITGNTVIIKNPSEKMKSFIKKMEEEKQNRRQELLKLLRPHRSYTGNA